MIRNPLLALVFASIAIAGVPIRGHAEEAEAPAAAGEPVEDPGALSGDVALTFTNAYVFRGYEYGRDSLVIQPAVNLSWRGFTLGFWENVDTNQHDTDHFEAPTPGGRELNEADISLSYERELGMATLSGGWLYYGTKYAPETEEVFVTASLDMVSQPTLSVYRDIRAYAGWYLNLAVSHELALPADLSLEASAAAGFYALDDDAYTALHDGLVKIALTVPLPEEFSLQPSVALSFPLSSKAKDEALLDTVFVAAATVAREF